MVLGGGRGLAAVLRALRDENRQLTAIVSIASEADDSGDAPHRLTGAAVEDLRRSLEALTGEEGALLRAIRRPLTIERLGRHPLGNLVIASVAAAFGDYGRASTWLGEQLGTGGAVLPATVEPVRLQTETVEESPPGGPSEGGHRSLRRLRFLGERVDSPDVAITAIKDAQWVVLAPGSLYRSLLPAAAPPDLAGAIRGTAARVLWLANLEPDSDEPADTRPIDHLDAIRRHGIRVDAVIYDPAATLSFDSAELTTYGVEPVARALRSSDNPARHDPEQLRSALRGLIGERPTREVGG